jgi:hypothetical protein
MRLNSTGKNPCGPLAGIRDRDRRPCEGVSKASATQPVVSARAAPRLSRGADVRSARSIYRPDTLCAIPRREPASLPYACAMISDSVSKRVGLVFVPRMAGRCTPMTGTDRSNLSYRTVLILFVLLGAPMAARSATLEDSAKELAGKIAASLPARSDMSIGIQNSSSLLPEEVSRVSEALKTELQNRGIGTLGNGVAGAMVAVTLSESLKNFVWTAEIHNFNTSQVVFMTVPRPMGSRAGSSAMPITLHSEQIWDGPEQILDAATASDASGLTRLVLFLPDGLEVQGTSGRTVTTVRFPSAQTATRDPQGILELGRNVAAARFPFRICTINLETLQLMECHTLAANDQSSGDMGPVTEVPLNLSIPDRVSEILMDQNGCGGGLTTGSGDDTQPDWVQALSTKPPGAAISNRVDFPGPVLALRGASGALRAIVRNLKTGNYEVYSLSCGK